jgi:hypothetical protein
MARLPGRILNQILDVILDVILGRARRRIWLYFWSRAQAPRFKYP